METFVKMFFKFLIKALNVDSPLSSREVAMGFSIRTKLLLAFFLGSLLMIFTSGFAIYQLYDLTRKADSIVTSDFESMESIKNLMDTILGMDELAKKYMVLKGPEMADIYWAKSREGDIYLYRLRASKVVNDKELKELIEKKEGYDRLFLDVVQNSETLKSPDNRQVFVLKADGLMEGMTGVLKKWVRMVENKIDRDMKEVKARSYEAMIVTAILAGVSLMAGFSLSIIFIVHFTRPIQILKESAVEIAGGNFDLRVNINRKDEIGHLVRAFNFMTDRLKELEALRLDASPLTGLPGNLAIEREIGRRLKEGRLFSLCHIDLDNFKPFADAYGYAWGSEIIKETAFLIDEAKRRAGRPEDFIGHIGGDDFIIVADPERAELMGKYIVEHFAERTFRFYSETERERGYLVAPDRRGEVQKFPLVTVTVSVVTDDGSQFKNPVEMARAVAEVKAKGKAIPGSNYVTRGDVIRC